ncbi:MAG: polyprenyl diphosphate synthase [Candidatus Moranbacteria bacterium]|nr:polyprenyl diphosphate synthase [Candidatus Moranbacteria bacterium]
MDIVPHHVVIIPDGNRRFAKELGREPWYGHELGAKNTEQLIKKAHTLGIRELSFWGSSLENLKKRPLEETRALLRIYETYFKELLGNADIHENRVKVRLIGRWREQFPESLKETLFKIEEATKSYDQYGLNFFLAYSGDDDMLNAVKTLSLSKGEVTRESLKAALMTAELPPVDYMIRTGGDAHLSAGFMMWDTANSELFFSDLMYPAFEEKAFEEAIFDFGNRARRHGK